MHGSEAELYRMACEGTLPISLVLRIDGSWTHVGSIRVSYGNIHVGYSLCGIQEGTLVQVH